MKCRPATILRTKKPAPLRVVFRGFTGARMLFEQRAILTDNAAMRRIVEEHVETLSQYPEHLIEIEFLDIPPEKGRFLRFGSQTQGMIDPMPMAPFLRRPQG